MQPGRPGNPGLDHKPGVQPVRPGNPGTSIRPGQGNKPGQGNNPGAGNAGQPGNISAGEVNDMIASAGRYPFGDNSKPGADNAGKQEKIYKTAEEVNDLIASGKMPKEGVYLKGTPPGKEIKVELKHGPAKGAKPVDPKTDRFFSTGTILQN